ncbi:hypothetical protein [Aquiluna sp. Uisw_065]
MNHRADQAITGAVFWVKLEGVASIAVFAPNKGENSQIVRAELVAKK